jgi:hypothetical protein
MFVNVLLILGTFENDGKEESQLDATITVY